MNQQFSKAKIKKIQINNIAIDKGNSVELIEDVDKEPVETTNNNPLKDVF